MGTGMATRLEYVAAHVASVLIYPLLIDYSAIASMVACIPLSTMASQAGFKSS